MDTPIHYLYVYKYVWWKLKKKKIKMMMTLTKINYFGNSIARESKVRIL